MVIKYLFVLLGAVALLNNVTSAPVEKSSEESSESNTLIKAVVKRFELMALIMYEFTPLYEKLVEKNKDIFEKVLEDPNVTAVKSDSMDKKLKSIRKYLKKIEKFESKKSSNKTELFELMDEFGELMDKFDEKTQLTDEQKILKKSFEDHGILEYKKEVYEKFEEFSKKFSKSVDDYVENLNEKGRKEEADLIEWNNKFKAETDIDKKIELLNKMIDASSEEDD